jgi:hypothetical protein
VTPALTPSRVEADRRRVQATRSSLATTHGKRSGALLGTKRDSLHPSTSKVELTEAERGRERQCQRYRWVKTTNVLRESYRSREGNEASKVVTLKSVGGCGRRVVGGEEDDHYVAVKRNEEGQAFFSGLAVCGSPWACGKCSPKIRDVRSKELRDGCASAFELGHQVVFVTFTLSHNKYDDGEEVFKVVSEGFTKMREGKAWKKLADKTGYVTSLRSMEVTYGEANGYHPHAHALFFFDRVLSAEEYGSFVDYVQRFWRRHAEKNDRRVDESIGVDFKVIESEDGIGDYLTKINGWHVDLEVTRGDLKKAKHGRTTIFEELQHFIDTGDMTHADRFIDFVRVTKGKKFLYVTRKFKDIYLKREIKEDEEVAAEETAGSYQVLLSDRIYGEVLKRDKATEPRLLRLDLLEACNRGRVATATFLSELSIEFQIGIKRVGDDGVPIDIFRPSDPKLVLT